MTHDVYYRGDTDQRIFRPLAEGRDALIALGFRLSGERTFHLETLVEAHLACVDAKGEAVPVADARHAGEFNRLDTHVPWSVLRSPVLARRVSLARIALARRLGWPAVDAQLGVELAGPLDARSHARFEPLDASAPRVKGGVGMYVDGEERARPKGVISAKDSALEVMSLALDADGKIVVGRGARRVRVELRDGGAPGPLWTTESGGNALAVHHDGRTIAASGVSYDGFPSNLVVFDGGAELRRAIACEPFTWAGGSGRRLLARVPRKSSADDARVELTNAGVGPCLDPAAEHEPGSIVEDRRRDRRVRARAPRAARGPSVQRQPVMPRCRPPILHLVLREPDGGRRRRPREQASGLAALAGHLRIRQSILLDPRALAVDPTERLLAIGMQSTHSGEPRELVVLDVRDGRTVLSLGLTDVLGPTRVATVRWHPRGFIAVGAENGFVALVDLDGHIRAFRASPRGIRALCVTRDARHLVVGGTEKCLRTYPPLRGQPPLQLHHQARALPAPRRPARWPPPLHQPQACR